MNEEIKPRDISVVCPVDPTSEILKELMSGGFIEAMVHDQKSYTWTVFGNEYRGTKHSAVGKTLWDALEEFRRKLMDQPLIMDEEFWAWWMNREQYMGYEPKQARDNILRYYHIDPLEAKVGYFIGGPDRIIDIRYLPKIHE